MNYERAGDDGLLFVIWLNDTFVASKLLSLINDTFVASKFAVVSFLCAVDVVSKFRGKNRQLPVISCALIVYSLGFWKHNLY